MLIWMCALHCEAKPIIDTYRLKKSTRHPGFDMYLNDQIACVVSGIGAIPMAGATAWAAALLEGKSTLGWINLGVAGHRDLPVGTPVIANKIQSPHNPAAIYPVHLIRHGFTSLPVISLSGENTDYHACAGYDMEAYAFMQTARHFSSLEFCQSIKVISDNRTSAPHRDKTRISQLIAGNITPIKQYASQMQQLLETESSQKLNDMDLTRFLSLAHFSHTQQLQLRSHLLALRSINHGLDDSFALVKSLHNSQKILSTLHRVLHQHSEQL